MHALLAGLVAQLPAEAAAAIEAQAEGIPLFAVETVRSLIDQEVVVASSEGYSLAGDLGELAVPESLHALLAARLDALDPVARSLAAAAAVIAGPFMADTLVAVAAMEPDLVHAGLKELTRRDVLQVSADVLSPQIGSYSFTHGLLAQVAYQTLSHRDLKDRHLRIAAHLAGSARNENDALAEVVARHYQEALEARPNDDDVADLRDAATDWLIRAAERARSTGALGTASRLFASAAELVDVTGEHGALHSAELWMQSAKAAYDGGDNQSALKGTERAAELRERQGRPRLVALSNGLRGRVLSRMGRGEEARSLLTAAVTVLSDEPGPDTVQVMTYLAAVYSMRTGPTAATSPRRLSSSPSGSAPTTPSWPTCSTRGASPSACADDGRRPSPTSARPCGWPTARGRSWSSTPRATSGTPSCATTPTRAWSTPFAGRTCPDSSGCGTAWASACSTRPCACSAPGSGTARPRWSIGHRGRRARRLHRPGPCSGRRPGTAG